MHNGQMQGNKAKILRNVLFPKNFDVEPLLTDELNEAIKPTR